MNEETKNESYEMDNSKSSKRLKKYYILVFALILLIGIITATYAFFQITTEGSQSKSKITATTECFDIDFEDVSDEGINNLDINYPITDEYAIGTTGEEDNLKPIKVKITNKCTTSENKLNYKLTITTLAKDAADENDKGYIPDNKVRYSLDKVENTGAAVNLKTPDYVSSLRKLLDSDDMTNLLKATITKKGIQLSDYDTVTSYVLDESSLAVNSSVTYSIKLWIDYYEGDSAAHTNPDSHVEGEENIYDNSTQGQKFASVISIIADGSTTK